MTTWSPVTNFQPKRWLLGNGNVVSEPAYEESGSGRMIRFPGTTLKGYAGERDNLITSAVQHVADEQNTCVWMRIDETDQTKRAVGFEPKDVKAVLHVTSPNDNNKTILWWTFRHATLPIEATVVIRAQHLGVNAEVIAPNTEPSMRRAFLKEANGGFTRQIDVLDTHEKESMLREFIRDNPVEWTSVLGSDSFIKEHDMLTDLLRKVRHVEDFDTIQIPDLRGIEIGDEPTWLDLELYETNVNGNFIADLTEVLENGASFEEAARLYDNLREHLRKLGLVFESKSSETFQKALLGDDEKAFYAAIPTHGGDAHKHRLFMHLATGTFVVECDLSVDHNLVAAQWDEARTIASITGEEPALLAFAREVARKENKKRTAEVAKMRGVRAS